MGNFAPKKREPTTDEIEKLAIDVAERLDPLDDYSLGELNRIEDDVEEDVLARYRRKRIEELKAARSSAKFGDVRLVRRDDFVKEVTEGSQGGQWVLVLLYIEASTASQHLQAPWAEAARRFPAVKFMRGVSNEVVPNFPDSSTPAVLVYHNEECLKQIVGLEEWGGRRCDANCVEWVLSRLGVLETELEDDPRTRGSESTAWRRSARRGEESDEEADREYQDDRCYSSNRLGHLLRRA